MSWLHPVTTWMIVAVLLWSSATYVFSQAAIEGFRDLGFPDFFRWQLLILKLIAAVVLVAPHIPSRLREWAYAGTALFFLTALIAHAAHRDDWPLTALNILFLALLATSHVTLPQETTP